MTGIRPKKQCFSVFVEIMKSGGIFRLVKVTSFLLLQCATL